MRFYYGFDQSYADITQNVYKKCLHDEWIIIPKDDNTRAKLFGDPCYGILKHIKIRDDTINFEKIYPSDSEVRIKNHHPFVPFPKVSPEERRAWWRVEGVKITDHNQRLLELQKRLQMNHGDFVEEFPEQLMIIKYIEPSDKVLEIGANIGRSGCIIASILDDDRNFVTLECNKDTVTKVTENRDLNQMNFHIESSALSKRPIVQKGIFTHVSEDIPEGYTKVDTIVWDDLRSKYPIDFNVLVADCEGSLVHIIKDEPDFLNHFNKVITENDYTSIDDYHFVRDSLIGHGFQNVFTQSGGWGCCYSVFYQVWIRQ